MKGPTCKMCKCMAAWLISADYLDPFYLCREHYFEYLFFQELDS